MVATCLGFHFASYTTNLMLKNLEIQKWAQYFLKSPNKSQQTQEGAAQHRKNRKLSGIIVLAN